MKKLFTLSMLFAFASTANADWRMDRFDVNDDGFVTPYELELNGCTVKQGLFNAADKNDDGKLSKKELKEKEFFVKESRTPVEYCVVQKRSKDARSRSSIRCLRKRKNITALHIRAKPLETGRCFVPAFSTSPALPQTT